MSNNIFHGPLSNLEDFNTSEQEIEQLKELDNLLRCKICYEYFNTCVVTDCTHNFCSICIRKYIQFKTECPVCFKELYDSQLRANRIVDNFIEIFKQLKSRLIRCIRTIKTLKPNCIYISPSKNSETNISKKCQNLPSKKFELSLSDNEESILPLSDPSSTLNVSSKQNVPNGIKISNQNKIIIPRMFQSPSEKHSSIENLVDVVACPVCSVTIPERNINLHLDSCLNSNKEDTKKKELSCIRRTHLPKLVFRLMSNNALKNKAKEYGLNYHGDYETLKNRIQRYTVLYNAECDKVNPRPVDEIIRQLEKDEKILANQKLPKNIFTSHADASTKEELNAQYLKKNKKSFDELIKKMKQVPSANNKINISESYEKSVLSQDVCQPSTSKSYSIQNFAHNDHEDVAEIEIEEMKIENIKNEFTHLNNTETKINILEKTTNEDIERTPSSIKKRLRNKRLNFENFVDCSATDLSFVNTSPIKLEPNIEIYKDENNDQQNNSSTDLNDSFSSRSPVIQKYSRKKRRYDDQSTKSNSRKEKKL